MRLHATISAAVFLALMPGTAHAICVATGQISRVSVNPGAIASSFYVTTSTPAQPSYLFSTTDGKIVAAVMAAQASHMTVKATGNAAVCGAPVGGVVGGGLVTSFTIAP